MYEKSVQNLKTLKTSKSQLVGVTPRKFTDFTEKVENFHTPMSA